MHPPFIKISLPIIPWCHLHEITKTIRFLLPYYMPNALIKYQQGWLLHQYVKMHIYHKQWLLWPCEMITLYAFRRKLPCLTVAQTTKANVQNTQSPTAKTTQQSNTQHTWQWWQQSTQTNNLTETLIYNNIYLYLVIQVIVTQNCEHKTEEIFSIN